MYPITEYRKMECVGTLGFMYPTSEYTANQLMENRTKRTCKHEGGGDMGFTL